MLQVIWLVLTSQSALFQSSIIALKFVHDIDY